MNREYIRNRKGEPNLAHYNDFCGARRRDNLIDITGPEWCAWWRATGCWESRGNRYGCCFMARNDTSKPFSLDNIELRWHRRRKPK